MMRFLGLAALALTALGLVSISAASSPARAKDIAWADSYEQALDAAREEEKLIFVAINMDGERANDRMAKDVYRDSTIVALSERTVNLIGSAGEHKKKGRCPRFGCESCAAHRDVEQAIRGNVLGVGGAQGIVSPQHIFLSAKGEVLLSVKYELDVSELEWCFHEAAAIADGVAPEDRDHPGRRPRRLVVGGVEQDEDEEAPITREEAQAIIAEHKKGGERKALDELMFRLVTADEEEAREYSLLVLRAGVTNRAGGRSAGGARNAGRGAEKLRGRLLRKIGEVSPTSYWEVCMEFADNDAESVEAEAVAALEQLAAEDSLPAMMKALRRASTDADAQGRLLRAIGSTAKDDSKARAALLKASVDRKDPQLRAHALMSLGWLDPHEDVQERLREAALPEVHGQKAKIKPNKVKEVERVGAVVSIGVTRDPRWKELLTRIQEDEDESKRMKLAAEAALAVIDGAPYARLKNFVRIAGGDEIPRRRLFSGRAQ